MGLQKPSKEKADDSGVLLIKDFDVVLRAITDIEPVLTLEDAGLKPLLAKNVADAFKTKKLTSIQKFSIPAIMAGHDVVGHSKTGSGKTGAYLIPIINGLLKNFVAPEKEKTKPEVLVLAPTRELAIQIKNEADKYTKKTVILSGTVYGGISAREQKRNMSEGVHILTGTPGRMMDLLRRNDDLKVDFSMLHTVVIDEADHIPDTEFKRDVSQILKNTQKKDIQMIFFSATASPRLEMWRNAMMRPGKWTQIEVGDVACPSDLVEQVILEVPAMSKLEKAVELLKSHGSHYQSLIFVNQIEIAFKLETALLDAKIRAKSISSLKDQSEREIILQEFRDKKFQCLVTTDVCCRGIHINELSHVLNYELPNFTRKRSEELIRAYVHRIGRTGRMYHKGVATSFFDPQQDHRLGPDLFFMFESQGVPIPEVIKQYEREARLVPMRKTKEGNPKTRKPKKKKNKKVAENVSNVTDVFQQMSITN